MYASLWKATTWCVAYVRRVRNERDSRKNYVDISLISSRIIFSETWPYEYLILLGICFAFQ